MQCLPKKGVMAAVAIICLLLIPIEAKAQRRINRYILTGLVDFRYSRYSTDDIIRNSFGQIYTLNLRGPIWHPRFMLFRTRVSFGQTEIYGTGDENTSQLLNFNFDSVFLPRSRFPLTLYFDRSTSTNHIKEITNRYGFRWDLRLRRLTTGRFFFGKTDTSQSNGYDTYSEEYDFGMELVQKLRAIDNRFSYRGTISDNKTTGMGARTHSTSFSNRTKLTRATLLDTYVDYLLSEFNAPARETLTEHLSARMNISFQPTRSLYHSYRYNVNWQDSTTAGTSVTHVVGAMLNYIPVERLSLRGDIFYERSETDGETVKDFFQRFYLSSGATYRVSRRLSALGDIIYVSQEWDPARPLTGETHVRRFWISAGLSYSKPIIRSATFFSHYKIGLNYTDSGRYGSDTRISHSFNTGFRSMSFRYFSLSSGYRLNINAPTIYAVALYERTEQEFNIDITSKGLKFHTFSARYRYRTLDSYVDILDEDSHTISVNARSTYFKRTNITAFYGYSDRNPPLVERTRVNTFNTNINHFLPVWKGTLNLLAGYGTTIARSESGTTKTTTVNYEARYFARLKRNLNMELTLRRDEVRYQTIEIDTSRFKANFLYRLRAWLIEMEYEYTMIEREQVTTTTGTASRLMLRATRGFRWDFLM